MKKSRTIKQASGSGPAEQFYAAVSGEHLARQSAPVRTAWLIERLACQRGWPAGELLGSQSELQEQLGVGREALREAISILSNRGVVEVRRGRNGGVQVLSCDLTRTASSVAAYLRAIHADPDQMARCVAGFDRLLAYRLGRAEGALPARRRSGEPVRRWLARACGHPVYLLCAQVIETLGSAEADRQRLAPHLVDAIEYREGTATAVALASPRSTAPDSAGASLAQTNHARAFTIAQILLERAAAGDETDMGNELSLCDEFSASRSVIRQSLRILQDLDVVRSRLGRSGGYEFKRPRPIGVIRQVYAWMAACRLCPLELIELVWDHNATSVRMAADRLTTLPPPERERDLASLDSLLDQRDDAQRFVALQKRLGEIAACPLIDIIARSMVSYQARQPIERPEPWAAISFLVEERQIVASLREGRPDGAEAAVRKMESKLREAMRSLSNDANAMPRTDS